MTRLARLALGSLLGTLEEGVALNKEDSSTFACTPVEEVAEILVYRINAWEEFIVPFEFGDVPEGLK